MPANGTSQDGDLQCLFPVCHNRKTVLFLTSSEEAGDVHWRTMKTLRSRLESTAFPDLGAMMEGYAQAAVELARKEFKQDLDFSADSVDALDDILVVVGESPERDVDFEVRLWGSY